MDINTEKRFAASLSVVSNSSIIILKFIAGFVSGSISIISEAIHSFSDMVASLLTFFSVIRSSEPADKEHPFGHGKYEDMSGFIEGLLIIFASVFIFYQAIKKLLSGANYEFEPVIGIWVMFFAVVANLLVSSFLFSVAKKSDSISIYADAQHLRTDVYSSLGVMLGLILIKFTGMTFFDPLIAIIVAVFILKAGISITKSASYNLLDGSLPEKDVKLISKTVKKFKSAGVLKCKKIKTRKIGAYKNIEITLIFPSDMTILECHRVCDSIEEELEKELGNTVVVLHSEPDCKKKLKSHT